MDSTTTSKLRNSWNSGDYAHTRSAAYRAYCRAPGRPQTAAFGRDYYEQRRSVSLADERGLRDCVTTSKAAIGKKEELDARAQTCRVELKESAAVVRRSNNGQVRPSTCRVGTGKSPERSAKTRRPITSRLVKSCQTDFDRSSDGRMELELESRNELERGKTSDASSSESRSIPDDAETPGVGLSDASAASYADMNANVQSARQLVTYHYVDGSKRLKQLQYCAVDSEDRIIGDHDRPAEMCNVSSYCVEVQGEGRLTTPGLADHNAPENEILVNLLRKQLTLSDGHCTQDDESLSLHLESLNSLMSQLINAKPPTGHLYYFAYGPDINTERFKSYINRLHTDTTWAFLYGFKLLSSQGSVGRCVDTWPKLVYSPQSAVEGRLYVITRQEAVLLDSHVGTSQRFLTILLPVWLVDSSSTAEYCLPALIHVPHDLLLE